MFKQKVFPYFVLDTVGFISLHTVYLEIGLLTKCSRIGVANLMYSSCHLSLTIADIYGLCQSE
jgi:hypothetical protein